jgi:hypothetical protein
MSLTHRCLMCITALLGLMFIFKLIKCSIYTRRNKQSCATRKINKSDIESLLTENDVPTDNSIIWKDIDPIIKDFILHSSVAGWNLPFQGTPDGSLIWSVREMKAVWVTPINNETWITLNGNKQCYKYIGHKLIYTWLLNRIREYDEKEILDKIRGYSNQSNNVLVDRKQIRDPGGADLISDLSGKLIPHGEARIDEDEKQ